PVRDERGGSYDTATHQGPVHDDGQAHAEDELDRHGHHRDEHGDPERRPPERIREYGRVVGQPDELSLRGEPKVVPEQAQPDGVEDWPRRYRQDRKSVV